MADGKFTAASAWNKIRNAVPNVFWADLVWYKGHSPSYAFIMWMVCKKCIVTKDKLWEWGLVNEDTCVLCNSHGESVENIFFSCPYSATIWTELLAWASILLSPSDWDAELRWAAVFFKCKNFRCYLLKLVMSAVIYHLWEERNCRVFSKKQRKVAGLIKVVQGNP
uniref:Reverse transcriptase zinc-binding domain-containing protein n=1 Tax=Davidia involucrata TaxID=16924 RepID=A0A5B7BNY1_DAVIN